MSPARALLLLVCLVSGAGCGVQEDATGPGASRGTALVRVEGNEAGPALRGAWRAEAGMFEPYQEGLRFGILFTVENRSAEAVTLLNALEQERGLIHRVGVRFALLAEADADCLRCAPTPALAPPFGPIEPTPLIVPPGRRAGVQFNFVMDECELFEPGSEQTYNQETTLVYQDSAGKHVQTIDLHGDQMTITAPAAAECAAAGSG